MLQIKLCVAFILAIAATVPVAALPVPTPPKQLPAPPGDQNTGPPPHHHDTPHASPGPSQPPKRPLPVAPGGHQHPGPPPLPKLDFNPPAVTPPNPHGRPLPPRSNTAPQFHTQNPGPSNQGHTASSQMQTGDHNVRVSPEPDPASPLTPSAPIPFKPFDPVTRKPRVRGEPTRRSTTPFPAQGHTIVRPDSRSAASHKQTDDRHAPPVPPLPPQTQTPPKLADIRPLTPLPKKSHTTPLTGPLPSARQSPSSLNKDRIG